MMTQLSGLDYAEVRLGPAGQVVDAAERAVAVDLARGGGLSDVLVLSHGWNNDMGEARALYAALAGSLASRPALDGRRIGIIGVLWPSKRFAESDLVPGGAASIGDGIDLDEVDGLVADLARFLTRPAAKKELRAARAVVPRLPGSDTAWEDFSGHVRAALRAEAATSSDDATDIFFDLAADELRDRLARPVRVAGDRVPAARRQGGAAGLGDALRRTVRAAKNLLNYATYYEMKARAGTVGEKGAAPLVGALRAAAPDVRVHLVGHSFGGRVVTAAASRSAPGTVASMTLLQAAFSHYGFADEWAPGKEGLYRGVLTAHGVSGPVVVTHTVNDKAVGIAYAIASRIAGQVAASVGDENDVYGGLGRNGALKTPEAVAGELLATDGSYAFTAGRVHNLRADRYIADHGAVAGVEVAHAILSAVATT